MIDMEKRLNKDFKKVYIINMIVFAISQLSISYIFFYRPENFFLWLFIAKYILIIYIISLIASCSILIGTITLGISNYKIASNADIKLKITIMIGILGAFHFLVFIFIALVLIYLII